MKTYTDSDGHVRTGDGRHVHVQPLHRTVKVSTSELERALYLVTGQTMAIMDLWTCDYAEAVEIVTG